MTHLPLPACHSQQPLLVNNARPEVPRAWSSAEVGSQGPWVLPSAPTCMGGGVITLPEITSSKCPTQLGGLGGRLGTGEAAASAETGAPRSPSPPSSSLPDAVSQHLPKLGAPAGVGDSSWPRGSGRFCPHLQLCMVASPRL